MADIEWLEEGGSTVEVTWIYRYIFVKTIYLANQLSAVPLYPPLGTKSIQITRIQKQQPSLCGDVTSETSTPHKVGYDDEEKNSIYHDDNFKHKFSTYHLGCD